MADPFAGHRSALRVAIRPLQSSFFAGEDFVCHITFSNTNVKVAHTQPLPQTEFFAGNHYGDDEQGSSASEDDDEGDRMNFDASPSRSRRAHPQRRVVSSLPTHSKSRSVDVRALGMSRDTADGEKTASSSSLSQSDRAKSVLRQLSGATLPERKRLIGKDILRTPATTFIHPWTIPNQPQVAARHAKSASLSSSSKGRSFMGLGLPSTPSNSWRNPDRSSSRETTPDPFTPRSAAATPSSKVPPRIASLSGKRTPSAPISSSHPHSRKKSIAQIQAEDLTEAFELDNPDAKTPSSTPSTPGANGKADFFRPASGHDGAAEFYKLGKNDTMESVFRDSINDWSETAKPPLSRAASATSPIYPAPDMLVPGSEKILWSFVQLGGTVEVDESLIKPGDFENLKRRLAYGDVNGASAASGSVPGTPRTIGGGDLGHVDTTDQEVRSGWSSYLRGPFGGVGDRAARHQRTGSTLQDSQERTLQSRDVPTFATPPSILAVDLSLGPGQSRTYTFKIRLPVDLPPSYHGKAIKLKYNLTLGTNRIDPDSRVQRTQKSRLIQIPIRIYNHVGASGFRPFYDLMNPVILTKEEAEITSQEGSVSDHPAPDANIGGVSVHPASLAKQRMKRADLEKYAKQLLSSSERKDEEPATEASSLDKSVFSAAVPASETCKAAVETLARTSTKVSYDISKDGKVAAVLTLVKSKYRLGDTIMGVISINEAGSLARIARVGATLETFEEIQPSISTLPAGRMQRATRAIHAEHHESALDLGRASFSLPIPSGASPEFVTSGVKLNWLVRLSFLTISSTKPIQSTETETKTAPTKRLPPPPHLIPGPSDGFSRYHVSLTATPSLSGSTTTISSNASKILQKLGYSAETKLETVECAVPVTILPNSTGFKVRDAVFFA